MNSPGGLFTRYVDASLSLSSRLTSSMAILHRKIKSGAFATAGAGV